MNNSTSFRVWDSETKSWLKNALISTSGEIFILADNEESRSVKSLENPKRYIINKQISMTDIKNVSVYEDDIMRAIIDDSLTIGVVKYASPQYVLFTGDNFIPISYFKNCEVIGNIREDNNLFK